MKLTTFVLLASIKAAIPWFCCSFLTDLLHCRMGQFTAFRKLYLHVHRERTGSLTENHQEDDFPKENKQSLIVLSHGTATLGRTNWIPTGSKTEISPTSSLQES